MFGSVAFENIIFVMRLTWSGIWIIFITIELSMALMKEAGEDGLFELPREVILRE